MSVVSSVSATDVAVPLPAPLHLGTFTVTEREYVLVEVETSDGVVGRAYSLSRGAPVAACVRDVVAELAVGSEVDFVERTWQSMYDSTVAAGRAGLIMRAISLVDIALWDAKARRAGVPVWKLLGGARSAVDVVLVAGYPSGEEGAQAQVDRLRAAGAKGYRVLKLARSADRASFRDLLRTIDDELDEGIKVVVDAAWVWRTVREAADEVRTWPTNRLAWVEDPFPPEQVEEYAAWHTLIDAPVAAGDEVADPELMARFVRHDVLDVVRIDPTTVGGITVARALMGRSHRPASTHTYPEIGVHLGMALGSYRYAETFDDRSGPVNPLEPSRLLLRGGPAYDSGRAVAPEEPGFGFSFDREAVERYKRGGAA